MSVQHVHVRIFNIQDYYKFPFDLTISLLGCLGNGVLLLFFSQFQQLNSQLHCQLCLSGESIISKVKQIQLTFAGKRSS